MLSGSMTLNTSCSGNCAGWRHCFHACLCLLTGHCRKQDTIFNGFVIWFADSLFYFSQAEYIPKTLLHPTIIYIWNCYFYRHFIYILIFSKAQKSYKLSYLKEKDPFSHPGAGFTQRFTKAIKSLRPACQTQIILILDSF